MKYYALAWGDCVYVGEYETLEDLENDVTIGDYDAYVWIFTEERLSEFVNQASELLERGNAKVSYYPKKEQTDA